MNASHIALALTCVLWALFGYWVWGMKKFMDSSRKRSFDFDQRITRQGCNMVQWDSLNRILETHERNSSVDVKAKASALADRIDALSARMDAVELACGLREKAKTMGGAE